MGEGYASMSIGTPTGDALPSPRILSGRCIAVWWAISGLHEVIAKTNYPSQVFVRKKGEFSGKGCASEAGKRDKEKTQKPKGTLLC